MTNRNNSQRYYDPQIGRFMTLDPFGGYIELPQTQMRYGYCMNNPLKYIDLLGLCHGHSDVYEVHKYNQYEYIVHYRDIYYFIFLPEPIGRLPIPLDDDILGQTGCDYDETAPYKPHGGGGQPGGGGSPAPADVTYNFPEYRIKLHWETVQQHKEPSLLGNIGLRFDPAKASENPWVDLASGLGLVLGGNALIDAGGVIIFYSGGGAYFIGIPCILTGAYAVTTGAQRIKYASEGFQRKKKIKNDKGREQ